ncbi:YceD family protein [Deferrisoma sp.]
MTAKRIMTIDQIPAGGLDCILEFGVAATREIARDRGWLQVDWVTGISGMARLQRSGPDVFVTGEVRATVRCRCVRCLEDHDRAVSEAFHLTFVTDLDQSHGEHELRREDMEVEELTGDSLDLAGIAVEQVLLALPDYPVCRDECRGLCPTCGADRNQTLCDCRTEAPDPRFAVLARWKAARGA